MSDLAKVVQQCTLSFLFAAHDVGTNNNADVVIIAVVDVAFVLVALNNEERILEAISDQYWMLKIHRPK